MTGDAVARVLARLPRARKSGSRWLAPCPAHEDRSPSLQIAPGDGCALVVCFAGCSAEAIVAALGLRMTDLYDDAGERTGWRPAPAPARPAERVEAPARPDGAADLWRRCGRVWDSPQACTWLRSRGIDPAAVEDGDLARVLPADGALPSWARCRGLTWRESDHLLVVPMFDHLGALVGLRARYIGTAPTDWPKSLGPAGASSKGTVFGDHLGRLLLAGMVTAEEWPALRVLVVEGEVDHLTAAAQFSDADANAPAVLGVVAGSWSASLAARVPLHAQAVIATDPDPAGDRYAIDIAATLAGRIVRRWSPREVA